MAVTGAGLEGVVATDSSLCFIDGDAGILSYQGYRIETLAENAKFGQVYLTCLWNGRLPKQSELDVAEGRARSTNRELPGRRVEAFPGWACRRAPGRCMCCEPSWFRCCRSTIR